jgi:predicted dehydrogenase
MKTTGFGIIGCGIWGTVHARTYAASPYVKLIGVCDQNKERAEKVANTYQAMSFTENWEEIISNRDISAVSIATPDFAHSHIVLEAIKADKHVLVEKPLAMTVSDCEKILSERDKRGVKLMVDFHNRWNIPFVHVRKMVESGELGEMLMMNIRLNDTLYVPTKMLGWASKSSPAHFLGSHVVDLVRWLSGSEIKKVFSVSRSVVLKKEGIDTPDYYQSILELSNGGTAYIENCWIISEKAPNVFEFSGEFVGTKGSTFINASHHRMIEKYTELESGYPDVSGIVDMDGKPTGFCIAAISHFIDCVVNDKNPRATGEDGLEATRIVEAMEKSAETGLPVNLE